MITESFSKQLKESLQNFTTHWCLFLLLLVFSCSELNYFKWAGWKIPKNLRIAGGVQTGQPALSLPWAFMLKYISPSYQAKNYSTDFFECIMWVLITTISFIDGSRMAWVDLYQGWSKLFGALFVCKKSDACMFYPINTSSRKLISKISVSFTLDVRRRFFSGRPKNTKTQNYLVSMLDRSILLCQRRKRSEE